MNVRNLSITVAILLVLCGVAWFLNRPAPPTSKDPRVGTDLLAGDVASKAAHVRITDAGKEVKLDRASDGSWTDASYYDFPADFSKLSRLINDLTGAKIKRLVTSRPDVLERLEFKDSSITLTDADGKELWRVTLGKNAEGGGRYVKFGDEGKGYLADLSSYLDVTPKSWADSTLMELKADDVAKVEIGFEDPKVAPVTLSRATKEDAWKAATTPAGQQVKASKIATLLTNFGTVRFTDTAATDDPKVVAAHEHSRTVKLTTFDGKSWTLTLGRKPEEKKPKPPAPEKKEEGTKTAETGSSAKPADASAEGPAKAEPAKPKEPEFETIPAGPVYVSITAPDSTAHVNSMMQKRAFQISDWIFTGLPAIPADLFEAAPPPAPTPTPAPAEKKTDETPAPAKP